MRTKKCKSLLSITLVLILSFILSCFSGCQQNTAQIPDPPITLETVTKNSRNDYVTFEFKLPKNWITDSSHELSILSCPADAPAKTYNSSIVVQMANVIQINNYRFNGIKNSEEAEQIYKDLLSGKSDSYKNHLNASIGQMKNAEISSGENFLDFLTPLLPEENENSSTDQAEYITDFQCAQYQGTNGKITEVQYSFTYDNEKARIIECYCEKIPYMVSGVFEDSVEISSGEIALWVADSLKVTEHFIEEDGAIIKK